TVVDPTGAGNAFSGAFLVGYLETNNLLTAGLWGSVAASLIVEKIGFPQLDEGLRLEARRRVQALRPHVRTVQI
ncbi:MAG: carbohydrate kinase, partial [Chloroflexota bacterium]